MTLLETKERFGYQWTRFPYSTPEFEPHFRRLIAPLTPQDFTGRTVLDAGCGYGRYALCAARYGAQVVGMDFSKAICAAKSFTHGTAIDLVCGDILNPPFRGTFDLVMSIGVLHHLPDPLQGFKRLARCVTPGGKIIVWVYSAKRKTSNALVERLRRAARPLSHKALHRLTFLLAIFDFILSRSCLAVRPLLGDRTWQRLVPSHFRLYCRFPFRVSWADWFDRLGAPTRHYFGKAELENWLGHVGAVTGTVVPTEDFGWTLVARLPG
ncbi:MAG TPA: class I SAM-dependent methyltransferase [Nitrospiraceae bacterium]|nr:class I SAM-dependent methyltransferase [Nitrospiraceae bacterium]